MAEKKRELTAQIDEKLQTLKTFFNPQVAFSGVLVLQGNKFVNYQQAKEEMQNFNEEILQKSIDLSGFPLITIVDDSKWVTQDISNWLWVTFTRSNPATDVYGINEKMINRHFAMDNLVIDARIKPHHAPVLEKDAGIEKKIDKLFSKGGELYEYFKKKGK